jgi:hypothetical protein
MYSSVVGNGSIGDWPRMLIVFKMISKFNDYFGLIDLAFID